MQFPQYFEGDRCHFDFKLNPQGTDFQQKVWQELLNIPFGKTMSYLDLSKKLGDIKSCDLVIDKETGTSKGFGFVEMAHPHEAENAINQLHGSK